jgi:hypothetical protein
MQGLIQAQTTYTFSRELGGEPKKGRKGKERRGKRKKKKNLGKQCGNCNTGGLGTSDWLLIIIFPIHVHLACKKISNAY